MISLNLKFSTGLFLPFCYSRFLPYFIIIWQAWEERIEIPYSFNREFTDRFSMMTNYKGLHSMQSFVSKFLCISAGWQSRRGYAVLLYFALRFLLPANIKGD